MDYADRLDMMDDDCDIEGFPVDAPGVRTMICPYCGSKTTLVRNRVITLSECREMLDMHDPVPLEIKDRGWEWCGNGHDIYYKANALDTSYNITWRCWLRKPTDADRASTPWDISLPEQ